MFDFQEAFQRFENKPEILEAIESIFKSNYPLVYFTWIENKEEQIRGIDLKANINGIDLNIDLKGVSYAKNHHYLEDISIELVSDYDRFLRSKGKKGKSWLFKDNSGTDKLLYYWLDENGEVRPTLLLIDFKGLREWAQSYFNLFELLPFLRKKDIRTQISEQRYATKYLGKLKGFRIYSAKNISHFTINMKLKLTYLYKIFKQFNLGTLIQISKKEPIHKSKSPKKQLLKDFF